MKKLLGVMVLVGCVSGCCSVPVVLDNGIQSKVFTPCTDDNLCFRETYNIAWDRWCPLNCNDYPISYRTKQTEFESKKVEYILMPKSYIAQPEHDGGVR